MTLEELQEEHLKLQEKLKEVEKEKDLFKTTTEKEKEQLEMEVKMYKEKNNMLVEHNNNLFRKVTHETKEEKGEKYTIDNLVEELGGII